MAFRLHPRYPAFLRSTDDGANWRIIDEETNTPLADAQGRDMDGGGFAGEPHTFGEIFGPMLELAPPFKWHCFVSRINLERGLSAHVPYRIENTAVPLIPRGMPQGMTADTHQAMWQALQEKGPMKGPELATASGYGYDSVRQAVRIMMAKGWIVRSGGKYALPG